MKFGFRKPSIKKSIKARTTAKIKRKAKKMINPFYDKKGIGVLNPKKAIYNKVYNATTLGVSDIVNNTKTTHNNTATKKYNNKNEEIEKLLEDLKKLSQKVNTSVDPNIFFESYNQMILGLRWLTENENKYKFSNKKPSENLKEILSKRPETINDFIYRYYSKTRMKVENLKQEKDKISYIEDFNNSLTQNIKYMDEINIQRYKKMYNTLKEECI